MKMILRIALCSVFLSVGLTHAESNLGDVALHQALLDLGTDLRLMCVAAHPDDEDGATLAYYRRKFGIKTVAVIATRGEGGQNETGPELYNELGVIRTREMMAAAEITGAELRFLNLPEFGFSKSVEETFGVWGREETLRRMVRVIREGQPDVIITHHDTSTGHGHHQAVGTILLEAFDVAANPAVFPEQLGEGLTPWQPARLYVRSWQPSSDCVETDISELNSAEGLTYAEIAARALQKHQSQGMGFFIERYLMGRPKTYYRLAKSAPISELNGRRPRRPSGLFTDLQDRVPSRARRLSQLGPNGSMIQRRLERFVVDLSRETDPSPETQRFRQRASQALAIAGEITAVAKTKDEEVVPGQCVNVEVTLTDFGERDVQYVEFALRPAEWFPINTSAPATAALDAPQGASATLEFRVPAGQAPTIPLAEHLFEPNFMKPPCYVVATMHCGQAPIELVIPVRFGIAPPISVKFLQPRNLAPQGADRTADLHLLLTNHSPAAVEDSVSCSASPNLKLAQVTLPISLKSEGAEQVMRVPVELKENLPAGDYHITALLDRAGTSAHTVVRAVDLQVPEGICVGVIQSYDDTFVKTLEMLRIEHEPLTREDFSPERLDAFCTVIVDIRAYLVRPDLAANSLALLEYIHRGGNLIVMYQKTFEWKPEFGPYPFGISNNRVTREDAPIVPLVPDHALFNVPNVIRTEDWEGWIQERGLYFADQWDEHYRPLIGCSDPREETPPGSLLIATYGQGHYVYCALALYRQLRELHPGALRLFANMLAL